MTTQEVGLPDGAEAVSGQADQQAQVVTGPQFILDLFAGPGGWSEGLRALGLRDIGIEWDEAACATRKAAGHLTIRADVANYPTEPFIGKVTGLIAFRDCDFDRRFRVLSAYHAVPPLLAAHVLSAITGVPVPGTEVAA